MAAHDVGRMIDQWAAAWSSQDTEKLLTLLTDDCVYEDVTFGTVSQGTEEIRAFANGLLESVPDFEVEVTTRFTNESWASVEWVVSGTHEGDFPQMPATGKPFSFRGVAVMEIQDGRVRRISDYWDSATLMRQVGLLPAQYTTNDPASGTGRERT